MGEHRTALVAVAALAALLLTGCAVQPTTNAGSTVAASSPVPSAGADQDTGTGGTDGDGPPQYSLNKRHHERGDLGAEAQATVDAARAQVERDLTTIAPPVAQDAVERVLDDAGAPDPWIDTYPADGRVVFEAQVGMSGCLVGEVQPDGTATVSSAGWVADGGCHALDGH